MGEPREAGEREEAAEARTLTDGQAGAAAAPVSDPRPDSVPLPRPSLFQESPLASVSSPNPISPFPPELS